MHLKYKWPNKSPSDLRYLVRTYPVMLDPKMDSIPIGGRCMSRSCLNQLGARPTPASAH